MSEMVRQKFDDLMSRRITRPARTLQPESSL
jgi:hypothetical protein